MITDEMINAVGFAMLRYTAPKGLSDDELNEGGMLEHGIKLLSTMSERALEAAYPLIRAQVLSDLAQDFAVLALHVDCPDGAYGHGWGNAMRYASQLCGRNLKGETK